MYPLIASCIEAERKNCPSSVEIKRNEGVIFSNGSGPEAWENNVDIISCPMFYSIQNSSA
jgi:hypothetical protein